MCGVGVGWHRRQADYRLPNNDLGFPGKQPVKKQEVE